MAQINKVRSALNLGMFLPLYLQVAVNLSHKQLLQRNMPDGTKVQINKIILHLEQIQQCKMCLYTGGS